MKTLTRICIVSALAVLLSGQAARSQVQLSIVNASFENPVLSPGQYTSGVIGWSGPYLGTQNVSGQEWFSSLPAGNNVAILDYDLTIAQTLTSNLSAGDYTLSAYVGQNLFINFPRTFALQLYAGSNLLAETTALAPVGSLNLFTVNFGALASNPNLGQSLTIRFAASIEGPDYNTYNSTVLDGVSLAYTSWNPYWAPAVGGGGTGTWSGAGTNWAATAGVQGGSIQSPTLTLLFGDAAGTVTVSGGVNAAAGMTFSTDGYTLTDSTITLSGSNAASNAITTATSVGATIASQLAGSGGMTKAGAGTLTLGGSAANILTGTTTVSAGTLQLNKSASTTAIAGNLEVANGATLLISQSEQVNNNASVTLSGGTITRGAGVSEVFGSLNLTAASFLDFGTGATGSMTFGTYQNNQQTESALLTLNNFMPGNSFTFSSTSFSTNSVGSYFTFGTGYAGSSIIDNGGSSFTITAIPEPSTILAALGLAGLMLWPACRWSISARRRQMFWP